MLQYVLPPNRKEAPRKKLRGPKRYFRRVFSQADSCRLDVSDSAWYDFWHYHPDRYGYGNLNWPMRARHIQALAKGCSFTLVLYMPGLTPLVACAHPATADHVVLCKVPGESGLMLGLD